VLTLFVVPSAYIIFNRAGAAMQRWLVGSRSGAMEIPAGAEVVEVAGD
jgi:hypothetical protein